MKKLNLTVLTGGQSTEHDIAIISAKNILEALDKSKYSVTVIYISQQGEWLLTQDIDYFLKNNPHQEKNKFTAINIAPGQTEKAWVAPDNKENFPVDCVIPMLHGTDGEDGVIQGVLSLLKIPYVGCDVLSSAICMAKDITKEVLTTAGIACVPWKVLQNKNVGEQTYSLMKKEFGDILFVKPVSLGSSVGVHKVENENAFYAAVNDAFQYDERVIVEPAIIDGREVECAVLGGDKPVASMPGEIVANTDFYSFDAKYKSDSQARCIATADLPDDTIEKIRQVAVASFKALRAYGMLRVDFLLNKNNDVMINEANTIPGFTNISLYPQMWAASGLPYENLLDELIQLALDRFDRLNKLKKSLSLRESASDRSNPDV